MKIIRKVEIIIERKRDNLYIRDIGTLQLVLGTKSASTDMKYYNVKKSKEGLYILPISTIKERMKLLKERKERIETTLRIMRKVIR